MTYSKGISAYEAKDFKNAIKYYQMALDVIPMDKNGDLKKNNLSEKNVYLYMAYAAIQDKDNVKTKLYLQKLMDLNYEDHIIYMQMVNIYLDEKDTATAMKFLESARQKFPTEKDLINQELNIYITQGKQDLLLEKINSAIELNPEDFQLIYVRGNVFDNIASDEVKKAKLLKDSITIYNKKKQVAKAQTAGKLAELAASNAKSNVKKAEADYLKVLELNPDYIDAYFNLGAMSNNRSSEIVEKINNITASTQTEYDKKYKPLKDRQDSILKVSLGYFNSALALAENKKDDTPEAKKEKNAYLRDILYSIQQVYANLGDEKKTIETKKRREAIED
jgi:tetratricopeptide (TPR) repeat protein